MDNLYDLNPEQITAMEEVDKAVLILAGAGSGKTRVITHKLSYLVKEKGLSPWSILAVTFTNKAAGEMKERALRMLDINPADDKRSRGLWIHTFHSACGRILRRDIGKLGYTTSFTIYDTDDAERVIKEIYKSMGLDAKKYPATLGKISQWKNAFISPQDALNDIEINSNKYFSLYAKIYEIYEKKMKDNNALDFDDLLIKTIHLFQQFPETLDYYRSLFDYVMVDEFQDTNYVQYLLVKMLSHSNNISVVGDDDQSIYSWRGADISNILDKFPKDFPDCKLVKLEQNYRSTNTILKAANSVIVKNRRRLVKNLWSNLGEGEKIIFHPAELDKEEAEYLGKKISKLFKEEKNNSIAVFYRMNFQSRTIEEILRKLNIPYKIFGGIRFYDRMEIKDLLAYLKVIANPSDSIALKRIINVPKRAIGDKTVDEILEIATKYNLTLFDAIEYGCNNDIYSKAVKSKLEKFATLIAELRSIKNDKSLVELFRHILDATNYISYIKEKSDEDEGKGDDDMSEFDSRKANIDELERGIMYFQKEEEEPTLENYLMQVNLQTDIDDIDEKSGYVSLMTIHKSKGLEFDTVFVSGCDEGVLPHYGFGDDMGRANIEEERRLFYVAMTRARKKLFLSSAGKRYSYNGPQEYSISTFIRDINPECLALDDTHSDAYGIKPTKKPDKKVVLINKNYQKEIKPKSEWEKSFTKKKEETKKLIPANKPNNKIIKNSNEISINEKLYHPTFGEVIVSEIKKSAVEVILVKDKEGITRNLVLKYANLSKTPYKN